MHAAVQAAETGSETTGDKLKWQWHEVEATIKDSPFSVAAKVLARSPRIVLATVYLFNREMLFKVIRRVKAVRPDCLVLVGGPEFLGDNRSVLESTPLTAVFRGDGEVGLPLFLKALGQAGEWSNIPGLCWLDATGKYHDNGLACLTLEAFEKLPPPWVSEFFDCSRPFVSIETARGCFARCAYCSSGVGGPLRQLSLDRVRQILNGLQGKGVRAIRVLDRTFNYDSQRCCQMLRCFAEEYGELRFHLEFHPALMNNQLGRVLQDLPAGLLHLEVGLQTGSVNGLQEACRLGSAEQARTGLQFLCGLSNLETHVDLLAGLPGVSLSQTLLDLQELITLGPSEIQLEVLKLLPGTEFYQRARFHGLVYAPDPPYEILMTRQIDLDELQQVRQISRLIDAFYNQPQLRQAIRQAVKVGGVEVLFRLLRQLCGENDDFPACRLERRFQVFHGLLEKEPALQSVRELLEYQWLLAGHSPEHGICQARIWHRTLPAGALLIEGSKAACRQPGKIWRAKIGRAEYWFVFPAGRAERQAAAVYRKKW